MNKNIAKLYKGNYIRFDKLLLDNYLQLRLTEEELVILLHLYKMEINGDVFLSLSELAQKMTKEIDELADTVDLLVTKGFISLEIKDINGISEECFSVFNAIEKIIFSHGETPVKNTKALIQIMETEMKRPLSSKEVQIIETWEYSQEDLKQAILDALKQKKMGVEYIDKILENNKKEVRKDMSYFNQFLE